MGCSAGGEAYRSGTEREIANKAIAARLEEVRVRAKTETKVKMDAKPRGGGAPRRSELCCLEMASF